ncbi:EVE domain-containing protein [Deinococcus hopiensis]|uniref:Predicted RNA-binding protein, contains PUA-like domain n=1 Tax=Deinococcus hopiensis KR-140 TaxID=695939 RepID=A0A1W1VR45_9DEIO|nr:EVE domain-containing protein [Deinococcus hopiensis]SMB95700.1 Predicted RNA-binding protein, contains PUA-like domain [Deinococcus hopiensis KR-140]
MSFPPPQLWLLKSEPDVFGYPDLARLGRERWNGVRNYQARNFLREMRVGDLGLFYHSNAKPAGVAGVLRVVREAYPDDLQFDPASEYHDLRSAAENPRWSMVDVEAVLAFPTILTLDALRALPEWANSPLTRRGTRLSVMPLTPEQFCSALAAVGLRLEDLVANHL